MPPPSGIPFQVRPAEITQSDRHTDIGQRLGLREPPGVRALSKSGRAGAAACLLAAAPSPCALAPVALQRSSARRTRPLRTVGGVGHRLGGIQRKAQQERHAGLWWFLVI